MNTATDAWSTPPSTRLARTAEDVTAVKVAAQLNQSCRISIRNVPTCLGHWRDLGDDTKQVRRAILGRQPGRFTDEFIVISAKTNDGFVGRYWQNFPREALRVIASDGRVEIEAGLKELARRRMNDSPSRPAGDKKRTI